MDLFEVTFHDANVIDENDEITDAKATIVLEDEELLACRICLATDTKLISIHEFQLQQTFETIIGYTVAQDDGFPQYLCHYCCTLLTKFESFRGKYERAQYILTAALADDQQISTDYLRTLDRRANELAVPLDFYTTPEPISIEYVEPVKTLKTIKIPANKLKKIPNDQLVVQKIQEDGREIVRVFYMAKPDESQESQLAQETMEAIEALVQPKVETEDQNDDEEYNTLEFGHQDEDEGQEDDDLLEVPRKRNKITEHPNINVVILSKTEQVEEFQKRKNSIGYMSAFLKCDLCFRGFLREKSYLKHMAMHEPTYGDFECDVCFIRSETLNKLRAHCRMMHQRKYYCRICDRADTSAISAKQHQVYHQEKQWVCDVCHQTFKQYVLLMKHKSFRHRPPDEAQKLTVIERRTCKECNIVFDSISAYNVHLITSSVHGENDGEGNAWQSCKKCGQSFENEDELQEHQEIHALKFECDECDARFAHERGVSIHKGQAHKISPDYTALRHICEFCGRDMESADELAQHKLTHSGDKPFECNACGKGFKHAQFLQIHMRTHTKQTPYSCQLCQRRFTHKANLNRHYKVHTGEKPFKCHLCTNTFTQSNSLKLHVRTVHMKLPDPYRHNRKKKRVQQKEKTIEELFPE